MGSPRLSQLPQRKVDAHEDTRRTRLYDFVKLNFCVWNLSSNLFLPTLESDLRRIIAEQESLVQLLGAQTDCQPATILGECHERARHRARVDVPLS